MNNLLSLRRFVVALGFLPLLGFATTPTRPNIIFIMTDDLGYGDVGTFFQNYQKSQGKPAIDTPALDAMAAEGVCFEAMYSPAPVCAPSRASFLTGVHQGNAQIRDNQFDKALEANHNVANVMKAAGYKTGLIGKWGLQGAGETPSAWPAYPTKRGFDFFYGYVRHIDGHEHYPKEGLSPRGPKQVWDNNTQVSAGLAGCYTTDLWTARAKKWITDTRAASPETPFFLFLAYDTPHATTQYPAMAYPEGGGLTGGLQWNGIAGNMINTSVGTPDSYCDPLYANATHNGVAWPDVCKRYATSVTRIDRSVGDLIRLLKDLDIDDNTVIVFTSDNGPSDESYLSALYQPQFFSSYGPFDGIKRDCLEGGIRVPAIARAPGLIPAGITNLEPAQFHDWLPTFAELAEVAAPARTDGVSLVPSLLGEIRETPSDVYVEYFYQGGGTPSYPDFYPLNRNRTRNQMQMVRLGDYVGVRYNIGNMNDRFEVYDIVNDPGQGTNLASSRPDLQVALSDAARKNHGYNSTAARPYDQQLVPSTRVPVSTPGLLAASFSGDFLWTPKLDGLTPTSAAVVATPAVATADATFFSGYLNVPASGTFTFTMTPTTAALLKLNNITLVDADYGYTPGTPVTVSIPLRAGKHPFRLYVKGAGAPNLRWKVPGQSAFVDIPASAFSH